MKKTGVGQERGTRRVLATGLAAALLCPAPALAFDEYAVGARPAAFSGAFTAVADDVHSLYYNPAGLGGLTSPQVTAYYARLLPNLSDGSDVSMTFMAYGQKLGQEGEWGGIGLGWNEFRLSDLFRERTITLG